MRWISRCPCPVARNGRCACGPAGPTGLGIATSETFAVRMRAMRRFSRVSSPPLTWGKSDTPKRGAPRRGTAHSRNAFTWRGTPLAASGVGKNENRLERCRAGAIAMTKHTIGTREQWLAARLELLDAEKELTRRGDELARRPLAARTRRPVGHVPVARPRTQGPQRARPLVSAATTSTTSAEALSSGLSTAASAR
jgi:hypothetical protein